MTGGDFFEERRLHPRLEYPIAARFRLQENGEWQRGTLRNLSAGGAALEADGELVVGTVLSPLEFSLPGQTDAIRVAAAVLRCEAQDGEIVAGLHFLNLEGAQFERVRLFVFRGLRGSIA